MMTARAAVPLSIQASIFSKASFGHGGGLGLAWGGELGEVVAEAGQQLGAAVLVAGPPFGDEGRKQRRQAAVARRRL